MREAGPYLQAVWSLAGAVALGALAGYWADRKLGTAPWLLLLGSGFGLAAGIVSLVRALQAAEEKRKAGR